MKSMRALTRLGMLAVGLGIGGVVAATPGIAAADTSSDWLSGVDGLIGGGPLSAADATPALNLAISYDGITLFQSGNSYAYSGGDSDFAVANGDGAVATAYGSGNYAAVDGTDSVATAGGATAAAGSGSSQDVAFVFGDNSNAIAGGTVGNPGNSDYAVIFGNSDDAYAGSNDVAYSEGDNLSPAQATGADYMFAISKFYGDGGTTSTAAASESTNLLANSDFSSALAESNTFWSDLLSGNTTGALAASTSLWSDLASAFDGAGMASDLGNSWTSLTGLF